ncbi:hypothetical protein RmaAA213_07130 [Rhodothermus marinus]|nr:hypothetical protein RmaAA213_07130 [Rhodothermus marinus]
MIGAGFIGIADQEHAIFGPDPGLHAGKSLAGWKHRRGLGGHEAHVPIEKILQLFFEDVEGAGCGNYENDEAGYQSKPAMKRDGKRANGHGGADPFMGPGSLLPGPVFIV